MSVSGPFTLKKGRVTLIGVGAEVAAPCPRETRPCKVQSQGHILYISNMLEPFKIKEFSPLVLIMLQNCALSFE